MKYTWIISLVFVSLSTQIYAQISDYFAGNPHWRINSSCSAPYPCVRDDQAEYVVVADTLMDSILWHKIQRQGISSYTYFNSPPITGECSGTFDFSEQAGFLRQDSMKIYFRTLVNSLFSKFSFSILLDMMLNELSIFTLLPNDFVCLFFFRFVI